MRSGFSEAIFSKFGSRVPPIFMYFASSYFFIEAGNFISGMPAGSTPRTSSVSSTP